MILPCLFSNAQTLKMKTLDLYSLSSQALVNHHFYFNTQSTSSGEGLNLTNVTQRVDISLSPISVTIPSTHILTNICKSPMSVTMANYQRGLDISRPASYYLRRNINKEYIEALWSMHPAYFARQVLKSNNIAIAHSIYPRSF